MPTKKELEQEVCDLSQDIVTRVKLHDEIATENAQLRQKLNEAIKARRDSDMYHNGFRAAVSEVVNEYLNFNSENVYGTPSIFRVRWRLTGPGRGPGVDNANYGRL
tara:strand:- start:10659 stop:10976 length:318 start_codon:yes stop_codon:yes gene_type:complete